MTKKILILGAGRGQLGLYKAAKDLGLYVIAGTMPGKFLPCLKYADEICYMDISSPDDVEKKSQDLKIDGVATCCLDTGIVSLGRIADKRNLVGLTEESAVMCGDKFKMKEAFMQAEVSTAKFYKITCINELKESFKNLNFPVVVKATDLQGSKGVYICETENNAVSAYKTVMKLTKKNYCIIEEFIEGIEFGAQSFVYNGEILYVMPHGDETYISHTAVPVGHYVPLEYSEEIIQKIEIEVKKAIKAIGLDNCAVNVDMILKDNKVYIIELTGRVGANCLPEMVEINYGIEYYKMIALMAIGESPLKIWDKRISGKRAGYAKMIFSTEKKGILEKIMCNVEKDSRIKEITFFKKPGDEVRIFENSNDCLGQIIVEGSTLEECRLTMEETRNQIKFILK